MTEHLHKIIFWRQLILLLILATVAILFGKFAGFDDGYAFYVSQFIKSVFIALISKVSYTFLFHRISSHYQKTYKKKPPHFIIRILQFIVLFFTLLAIIVFVLNKSVFSIMALGGVVGAGVALGVGPIILDAFSGFIHESENGFDVGDWLRVDEHRIGQVKSISWRTITVSIAHKDVRLS